MSSRLLSMGSASLLAAGLFLSACGGKSGDAPVGMSNEAVTDGEGNASGASEDGAITVLANAEGIPVGEARFTQKADGILVEIAANGLAPGEHGAHVHMTGRCDPPDFKSAGGHWNPAEHQHGLKNPAGAHMGDLPNLQIGADGKGELSFTIPGAKIHDGANPLLDADGAAMVIHADPDDMMSDPAGNAGGRIACGVIVKG